MFEEHEIVELTEDIDPQLSAGTCGTIVMVYSCDPPEYEIEFIDANFRTIAVCTVAGAKLRKGWSGDGNMMTKLFSDPAGENIEAGDEKGTRLFDSDEHERKKGVRSH